MKFGQKLARDAAVLAENTVCFESVPGDSSLRQRKNHADHAFLHKFWHGYRHYCMMALTLSGNRIKKMKSSFSRYSRRILRCSAT